MSATATSTVLDPPVDLIAPLDPALRLLQQQQLWYRARAAQTVLLADGAAGVPADAVPDVCIVGPFGDEPELAVGNRIVPPSDFTIDDEGVRWATGAGADRTTGSLHFGNRGVTLAGLVTTATDQLSVQMDLQTVYFDCELSANAGAHVALGGDNSIQLHTEGVSWDSATWVAAGLRYGYAVTADGGIGNPPVVVSFFVDTATGVTWQPSGFGTTMDENRVLTFDTEGELPDPDVRSSLPPEQRAFGVVFPTRMVAEFAGDGATFEGAMVVDETAHPPLVYALRGTFVDDVTSRLVAPQPQDAALTEPEASPPITLTDSELAGFRPFVQVDTPSGRRWQEVVRPQAVDDFNLILKTCVPPQLVGFVGPVNPVTKRPILPPMDPEVARISTMPGKDGTVAWEWYMGLAVPYLTGALSTVTDDPGAGLLNAKRARTWMRTVMPSASVYQVQMPALYAYRYGKNNPKGQNPAIQGYLDDQATTSPNHAAHAAEVTADAATWKQQNLSRMTDVNPEDVKAFTDIVDELSALGAADCYWAYRLFRFATSPAALAEIHGISLAPTQDSSLLAVRVQSTCATLSVLDPSGTFTKEYMKVISLVQLTNVLPQLLDYAGYADSIRAMVPQLLEDFIARHLDSADPDIQQAVRDLQAADQSDAVLELVNDILGIAGAMSGAYQWTTLVAKLGKYPAGITTMAGSIITAMVAGAGLALFVYGCVHLSSLSAEAKANLFAGAIQIVTDMTISIVKFGSQVRDVWTPGVTMWERMVAVLNPFKEEADRTTASIRRSLAQKITDRVNEGDYVDYDTWIEMRVIGGEEAAEAADEDAPALEEQFGLNLEPVEMGVGFVFALFNVIMSAIALSESTDPADIAQNALFLASSVLEGVAYAVGLATTFVLEVTVETAAVVASFVSACTFCASILAVIGLVITLAVMSAPQDTAIESFAKDAASYEALAMLNPPGYAIESFEAYAPKQGPSLTAVTVWGPGGGTSVLRVSADGSLGYGPADQTSSTSWYLTVDGSGVARLSSQDPTSGKIVCVAIDQAGRLVTAPIDTSSTGQSQTWLAALQATPTTNADGPVAGVFQVWSMLGAPARYLDLAGPQPGVSTSPTGVLLTMTSMKPQGLTMSNMVLSTADLDRVFVPRLAVPGSTPATWSLSPAPPAWLTLDPATGALTQALGVAPPLTPSTTFALTCDNQVGRAQTTFTIQVKAPATAEV